MQVRPATPADAEAVFDLHIASIRALGPEAYDDDQVAAWAATDAETPADHYPIDEPGHHFVVATRAGEVAGFGHLVLDGAEVQAVYVHPDHARLGVGSALLAHLEGVAYGRGLGALELTASLNAVPFYEAAGYEVAEETTHETGGPGVADAELPVAVMRKHLPPVLER